MKITNVLMDLYPFLYYKYYYLYQQTIKSCYMCNGKYIYSTYVMRVVCCNSALCGIVRSRLPAVSHIAESVRKFLTWTGQVTGCKSHQHFPPLLPDLAWENTLKLQYREKICIIYIITLGPHCNKVL
jgi:hypothetical protein